MTNTKKVYKEKGKQKDLRAILMQMVKKHGLHEYGVEDDPKGSKGERSIKGMEGEKRMERKMQEVRREKKIKYLFVRKRTFNGQIYYFVDPLYDVPFRGIQRDMEKEIRTLMLLYSRALTPTMPQPKKPRIQSSKKRKISLKACGRRW